MARHGSTRCRLPTGRQPLARSAWDWHFINACAAIARIPGDVVYCANAPGGSRSPRRLCFVQSHPFPKDLPTRLLSHWYSQKGAILGHLRDFDAAEDWLKKADELGTEPWTCLEWAALYTLEDKHDHAESAARRALELHPWYRPAAQWVAHFLVQKERDTEAIDFLTQATQRLKAAPVFAQLAALQIELKRYDDAVRNLDEFERFSPLMDGIQQQWLIERRCDIACYRGDYDMAINHARCPGPG